MPSYEREGFVQTYSPQPILAMVEHLRDLLRQRKPTPGSDYQTVERRDIFTLTINGAHRLVGF
jgi:hypothetical protein